MKVCERLCVNCPAAKSPLVRCAFQEVVAFLECFSAHSESQRLPHWLSPRRGHYYDPQLTQEEYCWCWLFLSLLHSITISKQVKVCEQRCTDHLAAKSFLACCASPQAAAFLERFSACSENQRLPDWWCWLFLLLPRSMTISNQMMACEQRCADSPVAKNELVHCASQQAGSSLERFLECLHRWRLLDHPSVRSAKPTPWTHLLCWSHSCSCCCWQQDWGLGILQSLLPSNC